MDMLHVLPVRTAHYISILPYVINYNRFTTAACCRTACTKDELPTYLSEYLTRCYCDSIMVCKLILQKWTLLIVDSEREKEQTDAPWNIPWYEAFGRNFSYERNYNAELFPSKLTEEEQWSCNKMNSNCLVQRELTSQLQNRQLIVKAPNHWMFSTSSRHG